MQFILLFIIATSIPKKGESCSEAPVSNSCLRPNDSRDIPFEDLGNGPRVTRFPSGSQVIATSYKFTCCGNVTRWQTFVDPGGNEDKEYDITFQVWRSPAGTDTLNEGCYSLVGENTFRDIILGPGGEVCESPPPDEQIMVQPGDVVGFYQTHDNGGNRGIQIHQGYSQEKVWSQVDPQPTGDQQCRFPVGPGRVLQSFTEHAPILSVTIEPYLCESTSATVPEEVTSWKENITREVRATTDTTTLIQSIPVTSQVQENLTSSFERKNPVNVTLHLPQDTDSVVTDTAATKSRDPTRADQNCQYAFIASIVTGTTSAILLMLLVATCILLSISVMKHKRRKKPKFSLNERLEICDSLMYNDVYMELKKGHYGFGSSKSNCMQNSFRYPPAVPVTLPYSGIGTDLRYAISSSGTEPPAYPPQPPTEEIVSTSRHYMTPNTYIHPSISDSHVSVSTEVSKGDNRSLVAPYAATDSCCSQSLSLFPTKHEEIVRTTSNVAYNILPLQSL